MNINTIWTADADTLMRQAPMTAEQYFLAAIKSIDDHFGAGHAADHPELIAAFMNAAALDFGASVIAQHLRAGLESIAAIQGIGR